MNIFVTGGSGVLGTELVPRLVDRGHRVTAASRHPRPMPGAGVVTIDLATSRGLDAIAGHDTVVHLASDPFDGGADIAGTENLVAACRSQSVGHLVGISIVGVDGHPWPYYRTKVTVERIISQSDTPWSLIRATQFHELIPRVLRQMPPVGFVPVPIGLELQPIDPCDVAERMVEIVEGGPVGRVADLGGPEIISARWMISESLKAMKLRRLMIPIPMWGDLGRASSDGRMLSDNRSTGATWDEWKQTLTPKRDHAGRSGSTGASTTNR